MKKTVGLLKQLEEERRRNFRDNLEFVIFRAEWLKRTSNKEWSKRQKEMADSIYRSNRKLRPAPAKAK
jgi:hypothetical protein